MRSAITSLPSSTGEAKHWEPGQSYSPTGLPRFLGDSTFTVTADLAGRNARIDWDRDMKYPAAERLKYSEIVTPQVGATLNEKGEQAAMSGIRLAALQRELGRGSPLLLLRALDAPQTIAAMPDQKVGDKSMPAVSIKARAIRRTSVLFRSRDQTAGRGAHARCRSCLRRLELRHDPVRLEGRRWLQARALSFVPAQRHRGAAGR